MAPVPDFYEGNAEPSFIKMRAAGVRIVAHKATEGLTFRDHRFAARRRRARALGLKLIPYHFARPDLHPNAAIAEAAHFVSTVGALNSSIYALALDFETWAPQLSAAQMVLWARTFNREVHRLRNRWPLFYSYSDFIRRLHPAKPIGGGLWLADYGPNDGRRHPVRAPQPWRKIKLHQYTSAGRVSGARPPTDLSQLLV